MIFALLKYFRSTTSEQCISTVLKLIAMLFRGSDELSQRIFDKYRNLFDYITPKLLKHGQEVTAWCMYAASNMCANGR